MVSGMNAPSIVWFRLDLRLADNPALCAAVERGAPIVPVFIWSPQEEGDWAPGGASKWWLHQSIVELERRLPDCASRVIIREGPTLETLRAIVKDVGATTVLWNRRYEPAMLARDANV